MTPSRLLLNFLGFGQQLLLVGVRLGLVDHVGLWNEIQRLQQVKIKACPIILPGCAARGR